MESTHVLIRLLAVLTFSCHVQCQDKLTEQDLLRLAHDPHSDTVSGYQTNIVHRDPHSNHESVSTVSVQFRLKDPNELKDDYAAGSRSDHKRKIVHIKNPYRSDYNNDDIQQRETHAHYDSESGASNQYASMQYTLPPEDFINQMRAESQLQQYLPTQQNLRQYGTTQQPQFQYSSSASPLTYDNNQQGLLQYSSTPSPIQQQYQSNGAPQYSQQYNDLPSNYIQYASPSPQPQILQSTPPPQYAQTPVPTNQYTATPSPILYQSSPAPGYLNSSPAPQMQFASSPSSQESTGIPEFGSRINSDNGPVSQPALDQSRNQMQIDHYNNALNGVRYPLNLQQQYEIPTTTAVPSSSSGIPENVEEAWRMAISSSLSQERQNYQQPQSNAIYSTNNQGNNAYSNSQSQITNEFQTDVNKQNNVPSANNLFMNIVHPFQNMKSHARDLEHETGQHLYSQGEYGWKLHNKKEGLYSDDTGAGGYQASTISTLHRPQAMALQAGGDYNKYADNPFSSQHSSHNQAVSDGMKSGSLQGLSYNGDTNQQQNSNLGYEIDSGTHQHSLANNGPIKSHSHGDTLQAQEFVNAALKAHEQMKYNQDKRDSHEYFNNRHSGSYQPEPSGSTNVIQSHMYNAPSYQGHEILGGGTQTQIPTVVSTFYGNLKQSDVKLPRENKWQNLGSGVEIAGVSNGRYHPKSHYGGLESITPNPYSYVYPQNDIVTSVPYLYSGIKDDTKGQPFDHAKALKNIQPIDLTDVIHNLNDPSKSESMLSQYARYASHAMQHHGKENSHKLPNSEGSQNIVDHNNLKQLYEQYKPLTEAYYKDKNVGYGLHIKPRPDSYIGASKGTDNTFNYSAQKQIPYESVYGPSNSDFTLDGKRGLDRKIPNNINYIPSESFRHVQQASNNYQTQSQPPVGFRIQDMLKLNPEFHNNAHHLGYHQLGQQPVSLQSLSPAFNNMLQQQLMSGRINQNMGTHQLDATSNLLSKLNLLGHNKQYNYNRVNEILPQAVTTINGIKIANPFNVDLKLVADMLKGKAAVDETHMMPLREQMSRPAPIKLDTSSLQQILSKSENLNIPDHDIHDPVSRSKAQFRDTDTDAILTGPQNPFQNVYKYSRSQQDDPANNQNIAAEASNNHPIGAVVEQPDRHNVDAPTPDFTSYGGATDSLDLFDRDHSRMPQPFNIRDQHGSSTLQHPNSLIPGRSSGLLSNSKEDLQEPYPLLKPPRPPRNRQLGHKREKRPRHHRMISLKGSRPANKPIPFTDDVDSTEFDSNARLQTDFRPPPVIKRKPLASSME